MSDSAGKGPPSVITMAFSFLTHFLLVAPVIYILAVCFGNYSFFVWHPIFMSLGAGLLIMEAVFSISGEAYIGSKLSRQNRVTMHWILHATGLSLMMIGSIIIVVNKVQHDRPHFSTTHSIFGLITFIFTLLVAGFGILTNNTRWLYPRVRPVLLKILHAFGGITATILLLVTLILGLYSKWWPGSGTGRSLAFTSFIIAVFFVLLKPVLGAISRARVVFGPPSSNT